MSKFKVIELETGWAPVYPFLYLSTESIEASVTKCATYDGLKAFSCGYDFRSERVKVKVAELDNE